MCDVVRSDVQKRERKIASSKGCVSVPQKRPRKYCMCDMTLSYCVHAI